VKKLKLLTAVLLICVLLSGCYGTKYVMDRKVEFTSPDNAFSATFPERPSYRTESRHLGDVSYSMEVYESEGFTRYLCVSYGDRPETFGTEKSIEDITKELIDTFAREKGIEILSQNEITLGDHTGMECVMSTQNDAGRLVLRIFITEKRIYFVIAEDRKDKIDSKIITRFLDSFAILEEP